MEFFRRVVAPARGSPNSNIDVIAGCHARFGRRLQVVDAEESSTR